MTQQIAYLDWSLDIDCPICDESNNLAHQEHDPENVIAHHIFSNDWNRLKGWKITCGNCGHAFILDSVEY